jgi:hydrogenase maturation protease
MRDLRQQLSEILEAPAAVVGVGNPGYGDDGVGVLLAEALRAVGGSMVFIPGTMPERIVSQLLANDVKRVLFLDAVEYGGAPGSVVLLAAREIQSRFPQISTHKISLGVLAAMLEQERGVRVWLLGIQPGSLSGTGEAHQASVSGLSEPVRTTMVLLQKMLLEIMCPRIETVALN